MCSLRESPAVVAFSLRHFTTFSTSDSPTAAHKRTLQALARDHCCSSDSPRYMKRVKLAPGSKKPIEQNSSRPFLAATKPLPRSLRGGEAEFTHQDVSTCDLPGQSHNRVKDVDVEQTISREASPQPAEGREGTDNVETPEGRRCAPSEVGRISSAQERNQPVIMSTNAIADKVMEVCDALSSEALGLKEAATLLSAVLTPDLLRHPCCEDKEGTERLFSSSRILWNYCVAYTNDLLTGVTEQSLVPHGLTNRSSSREKLPSKSHFFAASQLTCSNIACPITSRFLMRKLRSHSPRRSHVSIMRKETSRRQLLCLRGHRNIVILSASTSP